MSTSAAVSEKTDDKNVVSSLSADAAEFVPLANPLCDGSTSASEKTVANDQSSRGPAVSSVHIRDIPLCMTNCFPFVQLDGEIRAAAGRYPLPVQYPGVSHTVPMPAPPSVRLQPWQSFGPELLAAFPPQPTFGSLQYGDLRAAAAALPEDTSKNFPQHIQNCALQEKPHALYTRSHERQNQKPGRGEGISRQDEGLLPTPLALPLPGLHATPGLILTPQSGHVTAPWLLTSAPPPQPQHLPQQSIFLPPQQQQLYVTSTQSTTQTTMSTSTSTSISASATSDTVMGQTTGKQLNKGANMGENRPPSPVHISRSSQTNFPQHIQNCALQEKPHALYMRSHERQNQNHSKGERISRQADLHDSDSGYSSPQQPKQLVSCGTQVLTPALQSIPKPNAEASHPKHFPAGAQQSLQTKENPGGDSGSESKKKVKKKREQRTSLRSPHSLGSGSKPLSRSSSSISSAGTRPEEDDEKIDLHSWTDFPPMQPKSGGNIAGRSPLLSLAQSLSGKIVQGGDKQERVPLTIERTAHAPPWTIKYTGGPGDILSSRSRSSSGDTDKQRPVTAAGNMTSIPSDAVSSKAGRAQKLGQGGGLGDELSKLISNIDRRSLSAAAVHKHNSPNVATTSTVNSSPVSTISTTTVTSVFWPQHKHKDTTATTNINAGMTSNHTAKTPASLPANKGHNTSQGAAPVSEDITHTRLFPVSSVTTVSTTAWCQMVSTVPPPPLFSSPSATGAGSRLRMPLPFGGIPPSLLRPPPLPAPPRHNNQPALNIGALHSLPNMALNIPPPYHFPPPPPPATLLGQHTPGVGPLYPPPPLPLVPPAATPPGLSTRLGTPPSVTTPSAVSGDRNIGVTAQLKQQAGVKLGGRQPVPSQDSATARGRQSVPSQDGAAARGRQSVPSQDSGTAQSSSSATNSSYFPLSSNAKPNTVGLTLVKPTQDGADTPGAHAEVKDGEDKKRRRRRRRRGRVLQLEGDENRSGSPSLEHALSSSNVSESTLHFEDVEEFPDLVSGGRGVPLAGEEWGGTDRATLSGTSLSYSDVIKATRSKASSRTQSLTGSCISGDDEDNASNHTGTSNMSKRARKRRRRREQANKAAEVELAEISLEQQWLQQVGLRKSPTNAPPRGLITNPASVGEAKAQGSGKASASGGKKFHQPIAFDIAAMIDAIQKKPAPQPSQPGAGKTTVGGASSKSGRKDGKEMIGNVLDSTAPLQKRGKEREVPRAKKPSPLKKVILKEREQRKRLRLLDGDPDSAAGISGSKPTGVGMIGGESELSQEALSSKSEGTDEGEVAETAELSADLSPISQTSPISMSPASPGNSGVSSPSAGSIGRDPVIMKIHSRRFREYCTQILDKEIDQCCASLLQELVKFQDRMYHKDPVKAKSKRRVVLGLREVTKHLKLKRIKCVVISPNLEKIQSKGGLDEALNTILTMCQEQNVPFVFALGRRALGRACAKLVPVSVVGIFNYEGCESKYHSLISLTAAARDAYHEMVQAVEREVAEHPASQASSIGGVPGLFAAHMGHSRTPSGCSAISFTSSILSEPISENFPHAEPEVDSKGYEIVRDAAGNVVHSQDGASKPRSPNDLDDGNEADVEDTGETRRKKRAGRNLNSVRFGNVGAGTAKNIDDEQDNRKSKPLATSGNSSVDLATRDGDLQSQALPRGDSGSVKDDRADIRQAGSDSRNGIGTRTVEENFNNSQAVISSSPHNVSIPHIDSIHSVSYNLGEAILSQHTLLPVADGKPAQLTPPGGGDLPPGGTLNPGEQNNLDNDVDDEDNDDDGSDDLRLLAVDDDSIGNNYDDDVDDDDDDENDEIDENDVNDNNGDDGEDGHDEVAEAVRSRHRIIDKERIKSWLESQSTVAPED
ncbi:selenocysteine insertion sequence-binding protein 2-like [Plakobranchus ocellatus]|uniref:Selenocysteine insertion sequence-binding protein 2-like n=1 Tax=Plakobranchus ocellatus TaxID=259542 RepID=A0AAV3ZF25_9GAST|nr:selenocysteine insertion sequence-binding protein 2-like [Plakobranchus ocellatus]